MNVISAPTATAMVRPLPPAQKVTENTEVVLAVVSHKQTQAVADAYVTSATASSDNDDGGMSAQQAMAMAEQMRRAEALDNIASNNSDPIRDRYQPPTIQPAVAVDTSV